MRAKHADPESRSLSRWLDSGFAPRGAPRNDEVALQPEHRDGADRRTGAVAPFHRQADEGERALAQQRFQVAQALDVGDAEFAARLVNQQVHLAIGPGPHRIDAEMYDALPGQPFGGGDI